MMNELEVSFHKQQQFVSDASHELRTPIQAIEGHLSLIKRWGKDDPEVFEESLKTSLNELQRMKKMIEELLNLQEVKNVDEHAHANIEKVIKIGKRGATNYLRRSRHLICHVVGEVKRCSYFRKCTCSNLRNIMENGIRYNDKQAIKLKSKFIIYKKIFLLTIEDNGIGISRTTFTIYF